MEMAGENTLSRFTRKKTLKRLSNNEAGFVFNQVCRGIEYLHNNNICHRDLKMTNILIDFKHRVKIVDFGFATSANNYHKMYCGTPSYMAPEIILKRSYLGSAVDIWSLGVVLFKLLTGEYPFGCNQLLKFFLCFCS